MKLVIKLKVPAEPKQEFVSQGNLHAELVPNSTIETTNRKFADWLIRDHGLTEIKPRKKAENANAVSPFAVGYPAEFPGRDAFIAAEIPYETTQGLTREQMLKVPNIGAQTVDAILGVEAAETQPVEVDGDGAANNDGGAE